MPLSSIALWHGTFFTSLHLLLDLLSFSFWNNISGTWSPGVGPSRPLLILPAHHNCSPGFFPGGLGESSLHGRVGLSSVLKEGLGEPERAGDLKQARNFQYVYPMLRLSLNLFTLNISVTICS